MALGGGFSRFAVNGPAARDAVAMVVSEVPLPADYVDFMKEMNGGEGPVGSAMYLALWRIEDLLVRNAAYGVGEFVPGLFLFGSDGGGAAFGFDMRQPVAPVIECPFDSMRWDDSEVIAPTFSLFLARVSR